MLRSDSLDSVELVFKPYDFTNLMSGHFYVFFIGSVKRWESNNKHLILYAVCMSVYGMCVCVCVCVCLYSSTVEASSDCKISWWVRISNVMLWVLFQVLLPSSFISISKYVMFHLRRQNSSSPKTEEKMIWYKVSRKDGIYLYRI